MRSTFTPKTVLLVADQLMERLQCLHDTSGYLHRDLKPENLLMGREGEADASTLYLVDFGLARRYVYEGTGEHIVPRRIKKNLTGTARYASINAHFGGDQSRRDDMEAAGFVSLSPPRVDFY